jgi:hypothetical protein
MGVAGFGQLGIDGAVDALLHLHRRLVGKGQHQQPVQKKRLAGQNLDDAAGQHRGLAGAGAGGNGHVAPVVGSKVLKDGGIKGCSHLKRAP